jgi:alpha-tubulin suppressor-like RCC1 family protein
LTTDGRVFSWGGITFCLGREISKGNEKEIDEIEHFDNPIVKLATGRSHVLALDVKGRVYSWGKNDHGQLGHGDKSDKDFPSKIASLRNIV